MGVKKKAMAVTDLKFSEVKLLTLDAFEDERGFFSEVFKSSLFGSLGLPSFFFQDNHSYSKRGVIRGMHFQKSPGQAKLIYVVHGEIYDVFVDIRPTSKNFGKWDAVHLCAKNHEQLFLPVGFAHGFAVLSEEAHVLYKVSAPFNAKTERTFRFDDPDVGIEWPIAFPILSEKDKNAVSFRILMEEK